MYLGSLIIVPNLLPIFLKKQQFYETYSIRRADVRVVHVRIALCNRVGWIQPLNLHYSQPRLARALAHSLTLMG